MSPRFMKTGRLIEFLAKTGELFPNTERRDNIFSADSREADGAGSVALTYRSSELGMGFTKRGML